MAQVTVALLPALNERIDARLAEREYVDAGDHLRELVRRDREAGDRRWLRAMIQEGLDSGTVDMDIDEVFNELIAEDPDLRG